MAPPDGRIFVIPLTVDTAYGYIYAPASYDDVRVDFRVRSRLRGDCHYAEPQSTRFPNFLCKARFKGGVLKIGNAASFTEPLEAMVSAIT